MSDSKNSTASSFLENLFNQIAPKPGEPVTLLDFAKSNELDVARDLIIDNYQSGIVDENNELMAALIKTVSDFSEPEILFDILSHHFKFDAFFEIHGNQLDKDIWRLHAAHPTPQIARIGAELIAESLRFQLLRNDKYVPDITGMIMDDIKKTGLTAEMSKAAICNSVLAIQNAVVDYVATEGIGLPLHRAAALLPLLDENDVRPETSHLWKEKISEFKISSVYHVKYGEILKVAPVFS